MSASLPPLRVRPSAVCLVCGGLILLSMSLVRFCCCKMGHLNDRSPLLRTHHCCRLCDEDDACAQPLRLCVHALCAAAPTQKWRRGGEERRGEEMGSATTSMAGSWPCKLHARKCPPAGPHHGGCASNHNTDTTTTKAISTSSQHSPVSHRAAAEHPTAKQTRTHGKEHLMSLPSPPPSSSLSCAHGGASYSPGRTLFSRVLA